MLFVVTDSELLSKLGWNIWDTDRGMGKGLFSKEVIRNLVNKYESEEVIYSYNHYIQDNVFPSIDIHLSIHIPNCTKLLDNTNYENSEVVSKDEKPIRVYKLGTLRRLIDDSGIIEEITYSSIKIYD